MNAILGFVLIFAILIGYYIIVSPSKEEIAEQRRKNDSIEIVRRLLDSASIARELEQENLELKEDSIGSLPTDTNISYIEKKDRFGSFAHSVDGQDAVYYLESDLLKIGISSKGGKVSYLELKEYKTWDKAPLLLINSDTSKFGFTFFSQNRTVHTNDLYFRAQSPSDIIPEIQRVSGTDSLTFSMRLYADANDSVINPDRYIEYIYTLKGDNYMVGFDVRMHGMNGLIDANRGYLDLEWSADLRQQEKGTDQFNGSTVYYKIYGEKVHNLSESKDDEENLRDKIQWASFKQPFFSATLIAHTSFVDPVFRSSTVPGHPGERYQRSTYMKLGVPFQGSSEENISMSFYFGPNKYSTLRKYKLDLERQIPLGWSFFLLQWINRFAVLPVFNFLGSFGWNYGIVILILTILLKIVLFPIAQKTFLSSAKMRVLKPEVDELGLKYPKKEDAMKKQQAMMALYKKAGVNPMSGCIPVLLQLPILIAMFRFFPASIELRQEPFLWAEDLSTYDSIMSLPFKIPFYGDHVSLFTLLMTISTLIYTYLNNQMMGTGTQQMPGMKTMMYIMPIMFLGVFNNYSSGLSYYYLLVNLLTFAQMYIFRLTVNEEKIHRQIQENKLKPVKKSSWQKRLEDAAKRRGYPGTTRK